MAVRNSKGRRGGSVFEGDRAHRCACNLPDSAVEMI